MRDRRSSWWAARSAIERQPRHWLRSWRRTSPCLPTTVEGVGSSGDTAPYAVDREVEDLEALIVEAGGSAFVFGHSSGAALALEAAARGLAITRLALYEPPFIVDDSRPRPPEDFAAQLTELIASGRRGDAVELFMTKGVDLPADAVAQMRNAPMWPAFEAMAHTLVYNVAIMGDFSVPAERVGSVTIPTLVLDGGESPAWARHAVQAVVDALPNAQRRTLEGQTHGAAPGSSPRCWKSSSPAAEFKFIAARHWTLL